ncbi:Sodium/hydrogen exchanger family-domain-containing protein [Lipomyces tetrasporus]|uniref:Sodium/hydrogen exchanger n=1 Tax=Lipomyces tetrasporus TaxID=54092 RepID=A0AAD7QW01_9ASCO|nr:Sodium/hydrogen exchanger family-domain-containing protein [Lipomyces tetrasporus]KAJ8102515.1 Sodium/hydrogen exchanger family-domain-containing protein [Lipomyces tetrasporus]
MLSSTLSTAASLLFRRDSDADFEGTPDDELNNPSQQELYSSWALFILIVLLIGSLWTSYYLQLRKIQAVHETVVSIFAGMLVGLVIRILPGHYIQDTVSFKYSYFFNMLLPPIILNCGYELHQANFFRNIGTILTFAFAGTFISAVVVGVIIYIWAFLGLEGLNIPFVTALGFGATLSATDPVTILSIFNTYKVDPKLYTIIFGESILNDAVSIVMFETTQKLHGESAGVSGVFKGIGIFLMTFTISLLIGSIVGVMTALILKHSRIRLFPSIETCLILLFAYAAYFFSNGCHMSGIVSLLFCGITLKHYAYYNMSRRTQIATKFMFQTLAQLSENFIFIYLGLSLFTEVELVYKPLLIVVTAFAICVSRWAAVFPLSRLINFVHVTRARAYGRAVPAELPEQYQMMLFWAGLRGAVGVALAAGLEDENANALRATILVVVVLTVIVFGGTTARMLEILGIQTGVETDDNDSDIELDMESGNSANKGQSHVLYSPYAENNHNQRRASSISQNGSDLPLQKSRRSPEVAQGTFSLQEPHTHSRGSVSESSDRAASESGSKTQLTPPISRTTSMNPSATGSNTASTSSSSSNANTPIGGLPGLLARTAEDHARWFQEFDEHVLKPVLLDTSSRNSSSDLSLSTSQKAPSPQAPASSSRPDVSGTI